MCSLRACHMWLTRNHMFIREILGKYTAFIFWNFEISKISKFQKSELGKFIPNFPLKHAITSTDYLDWRLWQYWGFHMLIQLFIRHNYGTQKIIDHTKRIYLVSMNKSAVSSYVLTFAKEILKIKYYYCTFILISHKRLCMVVFHWKFMVHSNGVNTS